MSWDFQIELGNKDGRRLEILKRDVLDFTWRYDAVGGCSGCEIALKRDFDDFGDIQKDFDIQIVAIADVYSKPGARFDVSTFPAVVGGGGVGPGTTLPAPLPILLQEPTETRYRGFIHQIQPVFDNVESVRLIVAGYQRQLGYVVIHENGAPKNYGGADVGAIARAIIDEFVLPGTKIVRDPNANLVQDTGITISSTGLNFHGRVDNALKVLAEIGGNCEWGVLPSNEIFFLPRSSTVKQTWVLRDKITFFDTVTSTDEMFNRVFIQGGNGTYYIATNGDYIPGYQKDHEPILVSSIQTDQDAQLYGQAFFARFGAPQPRGRLAIAAIDVEKEGKSNFIERQPNQAMPSLGRLRVQGGPIFLRAGATLPVTLPATLSGQTIGGETDTHFRINSVGYRPIEGGLSIDVELGERGFGVGEFLKTIDFKLGELRNAN